VNPLFDATDNGLLTTDYTPNSPVPMAVATTNETAACLSNLQPLVCTTKRPHELRRRLPGRRSVRRAGKSWQGHLRTRKKPATPSIPLRRMNSPAVLGLARGTESGTCKTADSNRSNHNDASVRRSSSATTRTGHPAHPPDLPRSLQTVALAYALPTLARELPAEDVVEPVREIVRGRVTGKDPPASIARAIRTMFLRYQLLAGELPLALGYLFPEVRAIPGGSARTHENRFLKRSSNSRMV